MILPVLIMSTNISTFALHHYLYSIHNMITYNFGKTMNDMGIINWFSTGGPRFHSDC